MVSCSNAAGEGPILRTSVFVGYDIPSMPQGIAITRGNDRIRISRQPVTDGIHGGNIDLDNIRYTVRRLPDGKTIAGGIASSSCTDSDIPSDRAMYRYEYTLPYSETFADARQTNGPWGFNITNTAVSKTTWAVGSEGFSSPFSDHTGDGGLLTVVPNYGGERLVMSPLIDLGSSQFPMLTFRTINADDEGITDCDVMIIADTGSTSISLPAGIYIVRAGDRRLKVAL